MDTNAWLEGYVPTAIVLLGILSAWAWFSQPTKPHEIDAEAH
jgi:hypothetical protein